MAPPLCWNAAGTIFPPGSRIGMSCFDAAHHDLCRPWDARPGVEERLPDGAHGT